MSHVKVIHVTYQFKLNLNTLNNVQRGKKQLPIAVISKDLVLNAIKDTKIIS